jgi:glyoxylase-like metal-dependent hydrolase (beta-lactamase superfamily II)
MLKRLMSELHSAGVRPEDIDIIFFTHLHPDHVGWNLRGSGAGATFPSARYVINQADWDTFGTPAFQEQIPFKFWEETLGPLEKLGVLDLITGERALTDEIMAISTPGHTPGHMRYLISGRLPVSQAVESGSSSLALWGTEKVDQCFYHGGP